MQVMKSYRNTAQRSLLRNVPPAADVSEGERGAVERKGEKKGKEEKGAVVGLVVSLSFFVAKESAAALRCDSAHPLERPRRSCSAEKERENSNALCSA